NIPGRRVAAPDYVETLYRGNANVQPGQVIHGYERFQTLNWNTSLLALLGASDNPFGADQLTALLELGAFQVLDMPPVEQLQLGTPGVFFHRSAGVDGTGSTTTNPDRLNPSFQTDGYATEFAWGYRILSGLNYENVFWGVKLLPQATFFHDVDGRAALPAAEFVEGRKQASLGLGFSYESNWNGAVRYNWFFGGGTANALADRDYLQLNLSYDF
ncbi:MAG TPA: DUF1302 family protein, partial [Verrucomicrobiae bacterium]|nr:DUF1302 family protein [Verrucomicrobiae bacterium]